MTTKTEELIDQTGFTDCIGCIYHEVEGQSHPYGMGLAKEEWDICTCDDDSYCFRMGDGYPTLTFVVLTQLEIVK